MEIKVRNKLVEVSKVSSLIEILRLITRGIYNTMDDANAMHAHTSIK